MEILVGREFAPQTVTLLNAMTTAPSWARARLIDELVSELIRAGVWSKLDILYLLKAHNSQAATINWKDPSSFTLSATGTPTFTTDTGIAYDGSTNYHDTNYRWETAGLNGSLNSYHLGLWSLQSAAHDGAIIGHRRTTNQNVETINPRDGTDLFVSRINDQGSTSASNTDGTGHYVANRSGSSAQQLYKNGSSATTGTQSSTTGGDYTLIIGGANYSTPQLKACNLSAVHAGSSLTSTNVSDFYAALSKFMSAF